MNHKNKGCLISEAERQLRKEAVEYANASLELEGFELSPEYKNRQQLFINGIIDSSGLIDPSGFPDSV
jgi:hypothetical protein